MFKRNQMLTKKQKQIFDYIKRRIKERSHSLTQKEIGKHFRLAKSTVHQHIITLTEKGYLQKSRNYTRNIDIFESESMVKIPLLGAIAAGQPIEAIKDTEIIAVPKSKIPSSAEVYALRVIGNSMVDENINNGDIVLVKHQDTAENGQRVVALIDNHEATLKKFYKEKGHIRLQPANSTMEPLIFRNSKNVLIQGVVLDVIRETGFMQSTTSQILASTIETNSTRETKQKKNSKTYYEKLGFKLYLANCLDILLELPENSVDMIFADPPYNLSNGGITVHAGRMVSVNKGEWDKSRGFKDDYDFHYKWLGACRRILKPHGTLWVSGTYHSIYQCGHALQALGYHILNDIAWFKPNASPNLSCRYFTASHETLLCARKEKKTKNIFNYNTMKNGNWPEDNLKKPGLQMRSVWSFGTPRPLQKKIRKHPTQKPEDLLKRIVLASTNKGDLIVDPFTGSSTTGIIAYLYGRNFIGIDTEPKFLDLSIKRFKELDRNLNNKYLTK